MRVHGLFAVLPAIVVLSGGLLAQGRGAPETFSANAQVAGDGGGAGAANVEVHVTRYTPDPERVAVENALKTGGIRGFLVALGKAPEVGYVKVGEKQWPIRWAREQPGPRGRTIVVVTPEPIYFVGGGRAEAKPREGYGVAVIQLQMDDAGFGTGTMAAAAKVRPGGETGVQVEDYADRPIKLVTVMRKVE
jgi:hypothetical protein